MNNPHGNMVDLRDPAKPILLVADRGNSRIVRYTLDDKPIDIVEGTQQPCHFHEHKDNIVVPDLAGPVHILDKDNKIIVSMGWRARRPKSAAHDRRPQQVRPRPVCESAWRDLRSQRQHFRGGVG